MVLASFAEELVGLVTVSKVSFVGISVTDAGTPHWIYLAKCFLPPNIPSLCHLARSGCITLWWADSP